MLLSRTRKVQKATAIGASWPQYLAHRSHNSSLNPSLTNLVGHSIELLFSCMLPDRHWAAANDVIRLLEAPELLSNSANQFVFIASPPLGLRSNWVHSVVSSVHTVRTIQRIVCSVRSLSHQNLTF